MKFVVFTLGCKVNDCESGSIITALKARGHEVSDKLGYADVYIINTCAVTAEAEKKSRQAVARTSKFNPSAPIIVCGCASQKSPDAFEKRKNVFVICGARNKSRVIELVDSLSCFSDTTVKIDQTDSAYDDMPTPQNLKTRAYVKVQDGCNNFCSYCIVPYLRGRSRSRKACEAVKEVLECDGAEVVLTGINLSSYDDGENNLTALIGMLKDAPCRIRLGSLEVNVIDDAFLTALKGLNNFAEQFHLSLQSGSDDVLKAMNRHYTRSAYLEKCRLIRKYFPFAAITTDIIVGYPTETDEAFEDTLRLCEEVKFSQIHCFCYSPRELTVAAKLKGLPEGVRQSRLARLLSVAEQCKADYRKRFIGAELELVCEEYIDGYTCGYSGNYIRLYVEGKCTRPIVAVRAIKEFKDGLLALAVEKAK